MIPCSAEFVNGSENSLFLFFSDTLSATSFNLRCSQALDYKNNNTRHLHWQSVNFRIHNLFDAIKFLPE